jgi:hypothetical protein
MKSCKTKRDTEALKIKQDTDSTLETTTIETEKLNETIAQIMNEKIQLVEQHNKLQLEFMNEKNQLVEHNSKLQLEFMNEKIQLLREPKANKSPTRRDYRSI